MSDYITTMRDDIFAKSPMKADGTVKSFSQKGKAFIKRHWEGGEFLKIVEKEKLPDGSYKVIKDKISYCRSLKAVAVGLGLTVLAVSVALAIKYGANHIQHTQDDPKDTEMTETTKPEDTEQDTTTPTEPGIIVTPGEDDTKEDETKEDETKEDETKEEDKGQVVNPPENTDDKNQDGNTTKPEDNQTNNNGTGNDGQVEDTTKQPPLSGGLSPDLGPGM